MSGKRLRFNFEEIYNDHRKLCYLFVDTVKFKSLIDFKVHVQLGFNLNLPIYFSDKNGILFPDFDDIRTLLDYNDVVWVRKLNSAVLPIENTDGNTSKDKTFSYYNEKNDDVEDCKSIDQSNSLKNLEIKLKCKKKKEKNKIKNVDDNEEMECNVINSIGISDEKDCDNNVQPLYPSWTKKTNSRKSKHLKTILNEEMECSINSVIVSDKNNSHNDVPLFIPAYTKKDKKKKKSKSKQWKDNEGMEWDENYFSKSDKNQSYKDVEPSNCSLTRKSRKHSNTSDLNIVNEVFKESVIVNNNTVVGLPPQESSDYQMISLEPHDCIDSTKSHNILHGINDSCVTDKSDHISRISNDSIIKEYDELNDSVNFVNGDSIVKNSDNVIESGNKDFFNESNCGKNKKRKRVRHRKKKGNRDQDGVGLFLTNCLLTDIKTEECLPNDEKLTARHVRFESSSEDDINGNVIQDSNQLNSAETSEHILTSVAESNSEIILDSVPGEVLKDNYKNLSDKTEKKQETVTNVINNNTVDRNSELCDENVSESIYSNSDSGKKNFIRSTNKNWDRKEESSGVVLDELLRLKHHVKNFSFFKSPIFNRTPKGIVKKENLQNCDTSVNGGSVFSGDTNKCDKESDKPVHIDNECSNVIEELSLKVDDIVNFKVLFLSSDYTPTVSESILGRVISVNDEYFQFKILLGQHMCKPLNGKFTLTDDAVNSEDSDIVVLHVKDLISPKKIINPFAVLNNSN